MWPPSEFWIHALLSLWVPSIGIWLRWPASVSHSLGVVHIRNFSVFLSNFAMALWYITPTQGLSSRSNSRSSVPSDHPGLTTGIGYCVTLPVFGSILPRNIWPKSEYQTLPSRSSITSCGWISGFGKSYSVMITLVHHADPGVVVAVEFEIERAFRPPRLDHRDRILRHLAGLRVHLAEEHLAEVGVPDAALAIEHHVVRLDQRIRQVVLGDDYPGRPARKPRLSLERESPRLLLAQIDAGEPFRGLPAVAAALDVANRSAGEALRLQRRAAGVIAGHALENLHEAVGVVRRLHDALDGVAAVAVEQEPLLLVGARHARHPFGIGQVRGEIFHLPELEVGAGHAPGGDLRRLGAVAFVAGGARLRV